MSEPEGVPPIDSADARLTAARNYLATVPVWDDLVEQIAGHLAGPPATRDRFRTCLAPQRDHIETVYVALLIKHLTAGEIQAQAAFQASPAGRSITRKMVPFQAELIQALAPVFQTAVDEALRGAPAREGA